MQFEGALDLLRSRSKESDRCRKARSLYLTSKVIILCSTRSQRRDEVFHQGGFEVSQQ